MGGKTLYAVPRTSYYRDRIYKRGGILINSGDEQISPSILLLKTLKTEGDVSEVARLESRLFLRAI